MPWTRWFCAIAVPLSAGALRAQTPDSLPGPNPVSELRGVVSDSAGRAVSEAIVWIAGTAVGDTTDGDGAYRLAIPLEGLHAVAFTTPWLDSLGVIQPPVWVELRNDAPAVANLSLLPYQHLLSAICPSPSDIGRPIVTGFVRDPSGSVVPDATVVASWPMVGLPLALVPPSEFLTGGTTTDAAGFYALCGSPPDAPIVLFAAAAGRVSELASLTFRAGGVQTEEGFEPMTSPVWRRDLTLNSQTAAVGGRVVDTEGRAIAGAQVNVVGTPFSVTSGPDGRFAFDSLPGGEAMLRVQQIGYQPTSVAVTLTLDTTTTVPNDVIALATAPTELAPVIVRGERPESRRGLEGFFRRRERVYGAFVTREEFMVANPTRATQIIQNLRGVRVDPNPYYGIPNPDTGFLDTRRWIITTARARGRRFDITPNACPPLLFLDGHYLGNARAVDVDISIPVMDVQAAEAYTSSASIPPEFNRPGATCGVIAFWTR